MHARGKPIAPDVDLDVIARRTPGFTGADLANVINEAALLTARTNGKQIDMAALEEAIDRVMAGPERKSVLMSEKEQKIIAYHEGGHALVGHAMPNADPVHKVTIIPRGRALGYTMALPNEDKYLTTRAEMLDQLAMLLGGRTAEELVFHEPTTGAANDIEKATEIARGHGHPVRHERAARRAEVRQRRQRAVPRHGRVAQRDYSEEIASAIDEEVKRLIEAAHDEAWEVLVEYRDVLDNLVLQLLEKETLQQGGARDLRHGAEAADPRHLDRLRQAAARPTGRRSCRPRSWRSRQRPGSTASRGPANGQVLGYGHDGAARERPDDVAATESAGA